MSIKCVLFDVDGVIVISEKFSLQYCRDYNILIDEMLPFFNGDFSYCTVWKADLKYIIKPWITKWNFKWNVDNFLEYWFNSSRKIDNRMIKFIDELKLSWIKSFITTNQEKYRTEYMKNEMKFDKIFDYVFSSAYIWFKKPEKEYFDFVLDKIKKDYSINPEEILLIDDSQKNVDIAKSLAIKSYLYKNYEDFRIEIKKYL